MKKKNALMVLALLAMPFSVVSCSNNKLDNTESHTEENTTPGGGTDNNGSNHDEEDTGDEVLETGTVTTRVSEGGSIIVPTIAGKVGDTINFTVKADTGYKIKTVTVNGTNVTVDASGQGSFILIKGENIVEATFELITPEGEDSGETEETQYGKVTIAKPDTVKTLTATSSTVEPTNKGYPYGTVLTLRAELNESAKANYTLGKFIVDGVSIEGNTLTISKATYTLSVVVTPKESGGDTEQTQYGKVTITKPATVKTLTATSTTVEATDDGYPYGTVLTLAAELTDSAKNTYELGKFVVDGEPINGNTLTISKSSHTITVIVAPKESGGDTEQTQFGKVTITKPDTVKTLTATSATVTATDDGYPFGTILTLAAELTDSAKATHELGKFVVDGVEIEGNTLTISKSSYTLTVAVTQKETGGDSDQGAGEAELGSLISEEEMNIAYNKGLHQEITTLSSFNVNVSNKFGMTKVEDEMYESDVNKLTYDLSTNQYYHTIIQGSAVAKEYHKILNDKVAVYNQDSSLATTAHYEPLGYSTLYKSMAFSLCDSNHFIDSFVDSNVNDCLRNTYFQTIDINNLKPGETFTSKFYKNDANFYTILTNLTFTERPVNTPESKITIERAVRFNLNGKITSNTFNTVESEGQFFYIKNDLTYERAFDPTLAVTNDIANDFVDEQIENKDFTIELISAYENKVLLNCSVDETTKHLKLDDKFLSLGEAVVPHFYLTPTKTVEVDIKTTEMISKDIIFFVDFTLPQNKALILEHTDFSNEETNKPDVDEYKLVDAGAEIKVPKTYQDGDTTLYGSIQINGKNAPDTFIAESGGIYNIYSTFSKEKPNSGDGDTDAGEGSLNEMPKSQFNKILGSANINTRNYDKDFEVITNISIDDSSDPTYANQTDIKFKHKASTKETIVNKETIKDNAFSKIDEYTAPKDTGYRSIINTLGSFSAIQYDSNFCNDIVRTGFMEGGYNYYNFDLLHEDFDTFIHNVIKDIQSYPSKYQKSTQTFTSENDIVTGKACFIFDDGQQHLTTDVVVEIQQNYLRHINVTQTHVNLTTQEIMQASINQRFNPYDNDQVFLKEFDAEKDRYINAFNDETIIDHNPKVSACGIMFDESTIVGTANVNPDGSFSAPTVFNELPSNVSLRFYKDSAKTIPVTYEEITAMGASTFVYVDFVSNDGSGVIVECISTDMSPFGEVVVTTYNETTPYTIKDIIERPSGIFGVDGVTANNRYCDVPTLEINPGETLVIHYDTHALEFA